jgi:hypothetical protein
MQLLTISQPEDQKRSGKMLRNNTLLRLLVMTAMAALLAAGCAKKPAPLRSPA